MSRLMLFCGTLLAAVSLSALHLYGADPKPPVTLQGKLLSASGAGPVLKVQGRAQPLTAVTPYLLHTLEDKRLANREVQVEGAMKPDGTFEVRWLYTLRKGKLYRVRYFCSVCNIEAVEPGNCVCCQQPTELQEIAVAKTRQ